MKKVTIKLLVITLVIVCHGTVVIGNEKLLIRANNEFASKFYQVLAGNSGDNFAFCPLCLSTGIAMLSLGAGGHTLSKIRDEMGFPQNESQLLQGYQQLVEVLSAPRGSIVNGENQLKSNKLLFNGLFLTGTADSNRNITLRPTFEQKIQNYFQATPTFLNATTNSKYLEKEIGEIIAQAFGIEIEDKLMDRFRTNQRALTRTKQSNSRLEKEKIEEDEDSSLIYVNYLKFKAGWEKKFEISSTTMEPFYVSSDEILTVPMMRQTGHFNIVRIPELDCRAISIPYLVCDSFNLFEKSFSSLQISTHRARNPQRKKICKSGVRDSRLQMIVLLPNSVGGLENLESKLTTQSLLEIPNKFEYKSYLDLSFPKFSLESYHDLVNLTSKFGMETMSHSGANFSRISENGSLRLSRMFHHVSIDVHEKGSRTKSSHLKGRNPWTHPKLVKVDHPFLAFIHDKKLDAILIVLRVIRP